MPLQLICEKYREFGYEEVVTPDLFSSQLRKPSVHVEHYKDNRILLY